MRYLRTKREKLGHLLEHEDLLPVERKRAWTARPPWPTKGASDGYDNVRRQAQRQGPALRAGGRAASTSSSRRACSTGLSTACGGTTSATTTSTSPGCRAPSRCPSWPQRLAESGSYDAVVCLGAVIRGGTPHFEYVAAEAAKGIAKATLDTGVPVVFGVLTTDTIEQAVERAGTKAGNKGWAAATTALEMANLLRVLPAATRRGARLDAARRPRARSSAARGAASCDGRHPGVRRPQAGPLESLLHAAGLEAACADIRGHAGWPVDDDAHALQVRHETALRGSVGMAAVVARWRGLAAAHTDFGHGTSLSLLR